MGVGTIAVKNNANKTVEKVPTQNMQVGKRSEISNGEPPVAMIQMAQTIFARGTILENMTVISNFNATHITRLKALVQA